MEGTECTITLAQYYSLQSGVTYSTAHNILGCNGTEMSRVEIGGYVTVMYMWKGDFLGNMNATFQNDHLVAKAQFGLH